MGDRARLRYELAEALVCEALVAGVADWRDLLDQVRRALGVRWRVLADLIGVHIGTVEAWQRGESRPVMWRAVLVELLAVLHAARCECSCRCCTSDRRWVIVPRRGVVRR